MAKGSEIPFPSQVLLALAGAGALAAYPLVCCASPSVREAAGAGALLSTANVLVGYWAIRAGIGRSFTAFLKLVLGGMGIRMAVLLGALLVLIKGLGFHALALTGATLGMYLVYLVLEIVYLQRALHTKNQERS
ncbi:MAG: hypothetical protein WB626_11930 [Bacteroidota bacterium]